MISISRFLFVSAFLALPALFSQAQAGDESSGFENFAFVTGSFGEDLKDKSPREASDSALEARKLYDSLLVPLMSGRREVVGFRALGRNFGLSCARYLCEVSFVLPVSDVQLSSSPIEQDLVISGTAARALYLALPENRADRSEIVRKRSLSNLSCEISHGRTDQVSCKIVKVNVSATNLMDLVQSNLSEAAAKDLIYRAGLKQN